jgi:hypothetical protein
MLKWPLRTYSNITLFMGVFAIVVAGYFFVSYNVALSRGAPFIHGYTLATSTLALVGVLAIVMACCLHIIDRRLPPN